jgi:hypothetical protein
LLSALLTSERSSGIDRSIGETEKAWAAAHFDCNAPQAFRVDRCESSLISAVSPRPIGLIFCPNGAITMTKADDLHSQARDAERRARETKSLRVSSEERKREKGLYQLADTEDWLEGKIELKSKSKDYAGH